MKKGSAVVIIVAAAIVIVISLLLRNSAMADEYLTSTALAGFGSEAQTKETEWNAQYHQNISYQMDMYNRPLLKENELLPAGEIIGHEDDTLYYKQQMTEEELLHQAETYYGEENARYLMYGTTYEETVEAQKQSESESEQQTEQQVTEQQTETVIQLTQISDIPPETEPAPETEEPEPETPYYVEEHLDPDADQRYVEESPLWLLAHIMMSEAGYCDSDERLRVGSVVLNRVAHPAFPNTMIEVLYDDNPVQYAPTICPDRFYQEPTEECWRDAQWLLDNGSIYPGDVVYQATFPQGHGTYELSPWGEYFCVY